MGYFFAYFINIHKYDILQFVSTYYLHLLANAAPIDIGLDDLGRQMFSVNFRAKVLSPSDKFEEEVYTILVNAGIGSNTFIGNSAVIPSGSGPFTQLFIYGGLEPEATHNGTKYENLSLQAVVRAGDYVTARTRALAIWRELDDTYNTIVTSSI